jgi:Trp operon repressor
MSEDAKLTILTGALLVTVRDQVDHLIEKELRVTLAPAARKEAVRELKQGLSQRAIAKKIGVSPAAVQRDLAALKKAKPDE